MKVEIIGKKSGTFTDKDTGQVVEYGKLHCIGDFGCNDSGSEGRCCLILSCKPSYLSDIPVPCMANLEFNQYGRLSGVEVCSS